MIFIAMHVALTMDNSWQLMAMTCVCTASNVLVLLNILWLQLYASLPSRNLYIPK